jgi:hypothetical protein
LTGGERGLCHDDKRSEVIQKATNNDWSASKLTLLAMMVTALRVYSVFKRSGYRFAARKRVKARIWRPIPILSEWK